LCENFELKLTLKNKMMKTTRIAISIFTTLFIGATLFLSSCEKDPIPTAVFSTEIDGKTVSFINSSKDADAYAWEFGDGETSTEKDPTHTYAENGDYSAKLTATGPGGSNAMTQTVTIDVSPFIGMWDIVSSVQVATAYNFTSTTPLPKAFTAPPAVYIFSGAAEPTATECVLTLEDGGSVKVNGTATDKCTWSQEGDVITLVASTFPGVSITGEFDDADNLIISCGDMGLLNQFPDALLSEQAIQYKDATNIDSWVFTAEFK
jgi:PKD repeat protein